jgi:phospholipase A1/A2
VSRRTGKALLLASALACGPALAETPEWVVATKEISVRAGGTFQLRVIAPMGAELPDRIDARLKRGADERQILLDAAAPAAGNQRMYSGTVPPGMTGSVQVELAGRDSSALVLLVDAPPSGVLEALTARESADAEPPLSENDPMYFVIGPRGGYSARFQLSFKYRMFDQSTGVGRDRPWLAGFYFGYTQSSLWDLSSQSKPFRDTSYRPSVFWKWERTDDKTWVDAFRAGVEHESNGGGAERSRSIDTLFVRPEWHWALAEDARLEFTPKFYGYTEKEDNPDIYRYRGHTDWRVRYDSGSNWIATGVARVGKGGKGSLLLDLSRRVRDLKFGPIGGYLHFQFFTGYGEDILGYDRKRESQLRVGFAIVP